MVEKKEQPKKKQRNAKGQFIKGNSESKGRPVGSKNKSGNIRDRLKEQLMPFLENIGEYLIQVKQQEGTKEMLYAAEKFAPYCIPKLSAMSLSADMDRPISEEQRLLELNDMYTKKELSINFKQMTVVENKVDKVAAANDPDYDPDFDVEAFLKKKYKDDK